MRCQQTLDIYIMIVDFTMNKALIFCLNNIINKNIIMALMQYKVIGPYLLGPTLAVKYWITLINSKYLFGAVISKKSIDQFYINSMKRPCKCQSIFDTLTYVSVKTANEVETFLITKSVAEWFSSRLLTQNCEKSNLLLLRLEVNNGYNHLTASP
jgi:hypothetical protein